VHRVLNILAVDDEPFIATSVSFVLAGPGRTVTTAINAKEALAKIAGSPPFDVIITDHSMPGLSGLELVQRLRVDGFAGKIVVLSAHLTDENRRAYCDLKVDGLVEKPFDVRKLREVINTLAQSPVT